MRASDQRSGPTPYAGLALVGQLGFAVAVPLVAGVLAGSYLDRRFGGHGLVLAGMVLVSLGVAGYTFARTIGRVFPWKS